MNHMMSLVALFAFMLIPVWIPVFTVTFGAIFDLIRPTETSELTARMEALHVRPRPYVSASPASATS
jgi:hypothetical protein